MIVYLGKIIYHYFMGEDKESINHFKNYMDSSLGRSLWILAFQIFRLKG